MTEAELNKIQQRADKATLGPWELSKLSKTVIRRVDDKRHIGKAEGQRGTGTFYDPLHNTSYDSEFIAHSRQDIPDLLAHITELTGKFGQLEAKKAALKQIMSDPENQPNQFCPSNGCLMVKDLKPMAELARLAINFLEVRDCGADFNSQNCCRRFCDAYEFCENRAGKEETENECT